VLEELKTVKDEQEAYYNLRRGKNRCWALGSRTLLAALGAIALLLTGVAAGLRFAPAAWNVAGYDQGPLLAVLAMYAAMGAVSFYEKGTDKSSAYFRHVAIILAIRDLWTKLQFEFLKELIALRDAADLKVAEPATRERIRTLAEAFRNDINKVSTSDLAEWRTEFMASLSERAQIAKQGTEDVRKKIQEAIKAADQAAVEAKIAAEKAEEAAKAVGLRKITAHAKAKDGSTLDASKTIEVKAGVQDLTFPG
jgi:hypothetical protein